MKHILCIALAMVATLSWAEEAKKGGGSKKFKKTQEVSFDGSDVDGVIRSPDGAYLLQKRGVKFNSLYKVDNQMEKGMLDSVHYLK